jgi:phosphoglycolate phosphatase
MKAKPAKDVIVAACAAVGVDPRRVIMVGDTGRDVGAARAAGSAAVVVAYGMHRLQLAPALGADLVIRSIDALAPPA